MKGLNPSLSAFGIRHSAFGIRHSAFNNQQSTINNQQSTINNLPFPSDHRTGDVALLHIRQSRRSRKCNRRTDLCQ